MSQSGTRAAETYVSSSEDVPVHRGEPPPLRAPGQGIRTVIRLNSPQRRHQHLRGHNGLMDHALDPQVRSPVLPRRTAHTRRKQTREVGRILNTHRVGYRTNRLGSGTQHFLGDPYALAEQPLVG